MLKSVFKKTLILSIKSCEVPMRLPALKQSFKFFLGPTHIFLDKNHGHSVTIIL